MLIGRVGMNFDISMHSERPNWRHWKRLGSVSLKEAILLSLDICPIWYENYIIDNYQRADNRDYPSRLSQSEMDSLLHVLNYTNSESVSYTHLTLPTKRIV